MPTKAARGPPRYLERVYNSADWTVYKVRNPSPLAIGGKMVKLRPQGFVVDTSILQQQDRGPRSCFTMLASVREYAREQLVEKGTLESTRARHAAAAR